MSDWYDAPPRKPHSLTTWLIGAAFIAGLVLVAAGIIGKAKAQLTAISPVITTTTLGASAAQIVGVNPSRRAIQICAATAAITIAPVNPSGMTAVTPSSTIGIPVSTGAGNCFSSPFLTASGTSGGVGAAWQAFGNTAVVSVLEY